MRWPHIKISNVIGTDDDWTVEAAPAMRRSLRPTTWAQVGQEDPEAPPHPSKVAVIVSETMRRAEDWCRTYGRPRPGRPGAPIVVLSTPMVHRMRGLRFTSDDALIVLGAPPAKVVEEARMQFKVCSLAMTGK